MSRNTFWYMLGGGWIRSVAIARNTSVTIGDHFASFISNQVQVGRYGSASDVVRAGLRLLEEHETRVRTLQDALVVGEASGKPRPFDFEAFKARKRAEQTGE